ncbi:MAG: DUF4321 domain-containing protein [Clostridia bacterium]|nr:DUF4321 domain-containing protein [Clostridia bacterium]
MGKIVRNIWLLIILLLAGSILGTLLGQALHGYLPLMRYGQTIGLEPTTLDLSVLTLTFGATLKLNIASIVGFFIALFIYSRM